jgi:hypothetical protein
MSVHPVRQKSRQKNQKDFLDFLMVQVIRRRHLGRHYRRPQMLEMDF